MLQTISSPKKYASNIYRVMDDGSTSVFASSLTLVTDLDFNPKDGN